ncbi:hypothetical protein ACGFNU_37455 [Spirillospora sp. NPDC048911]|uniref:hypothetical protein n=1 Tax=Spirillospora sp. NPDC048911 TaxID=3364527 RepID=UPI00371553E3
MASKLWLKAGTTLLAAAAVAGFAPAAQAEAAPLAVPPGCTLRSLDGNRSSEARCQPGNHVHSVVCKWGEDLTAYRRAFTTYSMIVCPNGYRIYSHNISNA